MFPGSYAHTYQVGYVSPYVAFAIDGKVDDGRPGLGRVMAMPRPDTAPAALAMMELSGHCSTTGVASTAVYDVSYNTHECVLMFTNQF